MKAESEIFLQTKAGNAASQMLGHPNDVLGYPGMSATEKRALLASWASDARAVPGVPMLRQLDNGSIVTVDDILSALKALDRQQHDDKGTSRHRTPWRAPFDRRHHGKWTSWVRRSRRDDDDDDPPPCPAYAAIPPRRGSGGAVAYPEPALA